MADFGPLPEAFDRLNWTSVSSGTRRTLTVAVGPGGYDPDIDPTLFRTHLWTGTDGAPLCLVADRATTPDAPFNHWIRLCAGRWPDETDAHRTTTDTTDVDCDACTTWMHA